MNARRFISAGTLGVTLLASAAAIAQGPPVDNINAKYHPNLAIAQDLSTRSWDRIKRAQAANEYDLAGHAAKAERLLDEVNRELRMAANAANKEDQEKDNRAKGKH